MSNTLPLSFPIPYPCHSFDAAQDRSERSLRSEESFDYHALLGLAVVRFLTCVRNDMWRWLVYAQYLTPVIPNTVPLSFLRRCSGQVRAESSERGIFRLPCVIWYGG
jgi:hypothetical protein